MFSLLSRPTTTLLLGTCKGETAAHVAFDDNFPPAYVHIKVDANNTPMVQFVIHELIHVILSELVLGKFDETLEEVIVVSLDSYMWAFVSNSKPRLAKWNALIEKKLAEEPVKLKSIEEVVDRSREKSQ